MSSVCDSDVTLEETEIFIKTEEEEQEDDLLEGVSGIEDLEEDWALMGESVNCLSNNEDNYERSNTSSDKDEWRVVKSLPNGWRLKESKLNQNLAYTSIMAPNGKVLHNRRLAVR